MAVRSDTDALADDFQDVLRIVMRESAAGLDERVRLVGSMLDIAAAAGLTEEVRAWPDSTF